jgi:hypothetical protein
MTGVLEPGRRRRASRLADSTGGVGSDPLWADDGTTCDADPRLEQEPVKPLAARRSRVLPRGFLSVATLRVATCAVGSDRRGGEAVDADRPPTSFHRGKGLVLAPLVATIASLFVKSYRQADHEHHRRAHADRRRPCYPSAPRPWPRLASNTVPELGHTSASASTSVPHVSHSKVRERS